MLEIRDIEAGYGKKQVLFGLTLEVCRGDRGTNRAEWCGKIDYTQGNLRADPGMERRDCLSEDASRRFHAS